MHFEAVNELLFNKITDLIRYGSVENIEIYGFLILIKKMFVRALRMLYHARHSHSGMIIGRLFPQPDRDEG